MSSCSREARSGKPCVRVRNRLGDRENMVLRHIARYFGLLTLLMVAQTGCAGRVSDENTEIVSVEGDAAFTYQLDLPDPVPPPPPPTDAGTGDDAEPPPPTTEVTAQFVTWTCTGSPCPWGPSDSNYALVWPASSEPLSNRRGYTM